MHHIYKTQGVCSTKIEFDIENGIVRNVVYTNGCNGNLKTIGLLVEGLPANEVIEKLRGVRCGMKSTSCGDQLALAISQAMEK
ncbi:MAG: TIGR03905 family TSCPD domain-containing protein [Clostridia bacterium]|nr:TIGR03905 family TSCPD domain-containing protein [Clostridia bacterium]